MVIMPKKSSLGTLQEYFSTFQKTPAYVFDIDGTVADISQRKDKATREDGTIDWSAFYEGMENDTPFAWAVVMIRSFIKIDGLEIIFLTGRPEKYRGATDRWISKHIGLFKYTLLMRPDNCFDQDSVLKQSIYQDKIEPKNSVLAVFEDRSRNVEMFRKNGVICLQCDKGDF